MKAHKTINNKMLEDLENRVYVLYDKWKNYFNSTDFIKNVNVIKEGDDQGICVLTLKDVFIHSLGLQKSRKYRNIKNSSAVNKIILKDLNKMKFHIKKIDDYATIKQKIPVFEKYFNMLINQNDIPDYVSVSNNSQSGHIFKYSYIWINDDKVYVLGLIVFDSWYRVYKHIYGKIKSTLSYEKNSFLSQQSSLKLLKVVGAWFNYNNESKNFYLDKKIV